MTGCDVCGSEELIPFICRRCGRSFCTEHRLPERHNCSMTGVRVIPMSMVSEEGSSKVYARPSGLRTSRTELLHLMVAISVFFLIVMPSFYRYGLYILLVVVSIISLAFILHEFAHKILAQKYWLWSEFRLDPFGTLISLFTALMPFKIVAPGSVLIIGSGITKKSMGKIALVGPLTNVLLVIVSLSLSNLSPFFLLAALLNADLAVFNLIPVSVLDGRKVYAWNKKIWVSVFGSALLLWILVRYFF